MITIELSEKDADNVARMLFLAVMFTEVELDSEDRDVAVDVIKQVVAASPTWTEDALSLRKMYRQLEDLTDLPEAL